MSKRKASELDDEQENHAQQSTNLSLDWNLPAESIASNLFASLPTDPSLRYNCSKKLRQAFRIFETNESTRIKLVLGDCMERMPDVLFVNVLDFLPKAELVHRTSHVSKRWLSAARSPQLWTKLDAVSGTMFSTSTRVSTRKKLLELLRRPQFSLLKSLQPPSSLVGGKMISNIAKACPELEELDLFHGTRYDVEDLASLPLLFPKLKKLHISDECLIGRDFIDIAKNIGHRLTELHIHARKFKYLRTSHNVLTPRPNLDHFFHDEILSVLISYCPNLECFTYRFCFEGEFCSLKRAFSLTEVGIASLIKGCRKLKSLTLIDAAAGLRLDDLVEILKEAKNLRHLVVAGELRRHYEQPSQKCSVELPRPMDIEHVEVIENFYHRYKIHRAKNCNTVRSVQTPFLGRIWEDY